MASVAQVGQVVTAFLPQLLAPQLPVRVGVAALVFRFQITEREEPAVVVLVKSLEQPIPAAVVVLKLMVVLAS
jgi:hypothetical protein